MVSSVGKGSVGFDGAESEYCDLSGRGLTSVQIDRTLRVFATASTIDLSNNEIDKVPTSIPAQVLTLDMSFNVIASIHGIERLKFVQELHLAFNRLSDVSALELCPRLVHLNLSGNRLMNTKGLETLECLENLDISDNLIESAEALRALSLNQNLTHLTIKGNPLSQKPGYHVPMLDMIPSLIMLDDKKMRSSTKYKTKEITATKSLSYCRIYDDKKQFVIHKQTRSRTATTVRPLLPGDPASKYDGTMFLPPPIEPTHDRARAGVQKYQRISDPMPFSPVRAAPYLSMYDRLAQSNGVHVNRLIAPPVKPILNPNPLPKKNVSAVLQRSAKRSEDLHAAARLQRMISNPSNEGTRVSPGTSRNPSASRSAVSNREPWQEPQQRQRRTSPKVSNSVAKGSASRIDTPSDGQTLDDKQRNVLSVIQNLIQHKRQTLATLGGQKVGSPGPGTNSREYNLASQIVQ